MPVLGEQTWEASAGSCVREGGGVGAVAAEDRGVVELRGGVGWCWGGGKGEGGGLAE